MQQHHSTTKQRRREQVLIVPHADGFIEAYAPDNIDIKIARMPTTGHRDGEALCEDYFAESLPRCYQQIYFPGNLRAAEMNTPLYPSTIHRAKATEELVGKLNALPARIRTLNAMPDEKSSLDPKAKLARLRRDNR